MKTMNASEYKNLTAAVRQRLFELNNTAESKNKAAKNVSDAAESLLRGNAVPADMERVLRGGASESDRIATSLADALCVLRHLEEPARRAEEVLARFRKPLEDALRDSAPMNSGFKWFFTSSANKRKAENAASFLWEAMNGTFAQRSENVSSETRRAVENAPAASAEEFRSEREEYRALLEKVCPRIRQRITAPSEMGAVYRRHEKLLAEMQKAKETFDRSCNAVSGAAEKMVTYETMNILSEVSVDEINKAYGGIRVKALHDDGVHTVADIIRTSARRLEAINGISEEKSHFLKQVAAGYLEETKKNTKIRLNADARSPEADKLVSALYEVKRFQKDYDTIVKIETSCRAEILREMEILNNACAGLSWLFLSDEQKKGIRGAYEDLRKLLGSRYPEFVGTAAGRILGRTSEAPQTGTAGYGGTSEAPQTASAGFVTQPGGTAAPEAEQAVWQSGSAVWVTPDPWADFMLSPVSYYTILESICPGVLGNDDSLYGLPEDIAHAVASEPVYKEGLKCTLRRYQEWGVKYILHQKRVLLGDEMGLGKTIQAIAAMVSLRNTGETHFGVICPASVLMNWCREIEKHSDLAAVKLHGAYREQAFDEWLQNGGVFVTTYETAGFLTEKIFPLGMLVVDEAHYIKNPEAKRTINVKNICERAERLLLMTGTALENRVGEMLRLMRILRPEIADEALGKSYLSAAPQFRGIIAPVYYRRKREEVLTELPELIEAEEWCELLPEEKSIYRKNVLLRAYPDIRRVSWNAEDARQSSKARRMMEIVEEAAAENRKVLIFSFFLSTIDTVMNVLGGRAFGPITGAVPSNRRLEIIDAFDNAPAGSVLVAQITAGGTGLNIQSASVVILCEPQLKPSIENQAISRAYRMGQARNVLVYRLLCSDTVDERLMEILADKQRIFDAFADPSAAADLSGQIDETTFHDIVEEEAALILREDT